MKRTLKLGWVIYLLSVLQASQVMGQTTIGGNKTIFTRDSCQWFGGPDKDICVGEFTRLGYRIPPKEDYCFQWEPAYGMIDEEQLQSHYPLIRPFRSTLYYLTVKDKEGNVIAKEDVLIDVFLWNFPKINPMMWCDPY